MNINIVRASRLVLGALTLAGVIHAAELKEQYTFDNPARRGENAINGYDKGFYTNGPYNGAEPAWVAGASGLAGDFAMGLDDGSFPYSEYLASRTVPDVVNAGATADGGIPTVFSISMWINPQEKTTINNMQVLLSNTFYNGDFQPGFRLSLNTENANFAEPDDRTIAFYSNAVGGATPVNVVSAPGAFQHNKWQMLCLLVDRVNNTVRVYIDGTKVLDGAVSPDMNIEHIVGNGSNDYIWLGSAFGGNRTYKGAIDNLRIYDGLLSDAEIAAQSTDEPLPKTVLSQFNFDDGANRGKNVANAADVNGMAFDNVTFDEVGPSGNASDAAAGMAVGSQYGSYTRFVAEAGFPLEFTVTLWMKPQEKTTVNNRQALLSNTFNYDFQPGWRLTLNTENENAADPDDRTIAFYSGSGASFNGNIAGINVVSAPGAFEHDQWQLVGVAVDRVANTVKIYVDAEKVAEGKTQAGFSVVSTYPGGNNGVLFVGSIGNDNVLQGAIDDLRFHQGLLDEANFRYMIDTVPVELSTFAVE